VELLRVAVQRPRRVPAQHLEVARRVRVALERRLADGVELEVDRIDDDVAAGELAELDQLGRRERRLHGAAPGDHDDLLDRGAGDRLAGRVRRVGHIQLLGGQREHPGDVDRDVAGSHHDHPFDREVELELLAVRVAVVPGDELGGRPGARQVFAGDAHAPVGLRADGVDNRVVEPDEVVVEEVAAGLDVAEEAKTGLLGDLLVGARDGLDLGMVGRDAEPDEAPGRR
jgi:hypothetical protein